MLRVILLALIMAPMVSGCATIVRGTEQEVFVNTDPVGADVRFSNGLSCTSPCKQVVKRNESLTLTISKAGCATQTSAMVPTLAGGGVILGGLIDYGTGAVYDLQPNPLTVTLNCNQYGANSTAPGVIASSSGPARTLPGPRPVEGTRLSDFSDREIQAYCTEDWTIRTGADGRTEYNPCKMPSAFD